ncbi:Abortive infection protein (plasmid) [Gemmatirosa kalamazoonensis]|uniref:Abortive infection protein n=1 Tax=Gemmatirosa kalamazoonensis TaxID=861299 RepID=W0RTL7_9BACT|nr:CPBP family intramembrane glutamic endopeptidase [Gemmatirosa kalamazoonensis]AHG93792.1 Abortive infection protein [Gemmatirosa kalamazoonensis]
MALGVAPIAATFAAYLVAPTVVLLGRITPERRAPVRELTAVALFWLPIELGLLPRIPGPNGVDLSKLVAFGAALVLFLVVRRLPDVGFTFALRWRDVGVAVVACALYAPVAIAVGLTTRFIAWHPQPSAATLVVRPLLIYALIALPEEFLFRGLIQNLLARWWGPERPWPLLVASVIFGLAHLPDPRYVVLATLAGVAYGLVYEHTGRVTASAITHALVDALWVLLLPR